MNNQQENELIEKAKSNPKEFEGLYNEHFQSIFLFLFKRLGSKEEAADLTSQVFLKALTHLKKYTSYGVPFSSWLFRIATNELNYYYRKSSKQRHVLLTDTIIENMNEETGLNLEDMFIQLAKGLQTLKLEALQLIELRFFEKRSFKEIAAILEVTENNAKVKTYRVLDQLKKQMKDVEI